MSITVDEDDDDDGVFEWCQSDAWFYSVCGGFTEML